MCRSGKAKRGRYRLRKRWNWGEEKNLRENCSKERYDEEIGNKERERGKARVLKEEHRG